MINIKFNYLLLYHKFHIMLIDKGGKMKKFNIENAIVACNNIVNNAVDNFTGVALAVVNKHFDMNTIISLRPNLQVPYINFFDNQTEFEEYLNSGSKLGGVVHDGFHFMNTQGTITHSAQYYVPQPVRHLPINELCGTRYHTALFGSVMKGVEFIITISSNKSIYIFQNGEIIYEKKSQDYQEI